MKYYIKGKYWKVIYKNLRQEKGLHTKTEEKLGLFYEAIWYVSRTGSLENACQYPPAFSDKER